MVSVYKTNVGTHNQLDTIRPLLNRINTITHWNIDQEDCDKVLRVVWNEDLSVVLISKIQRLGFICEELE
ncbi:MAG: hypothetical protein COA58_01265 [Bacteroidetes bacterium]|nr:MAG: hypothetical protein COA58_01265 [Bacteroidota bacterium]